MDHLHLSGLDTVRDVQITFADHERVMLFLSKAGDPKNAFLIYFPLVYGLSHVHGRRLMLAAVVGEWLNIVFKWVLFGHRPYWWVREYSHLHDVEEIEQYHLTCETGPGSPSGHAMVTAAVFYAMMDASKSFLPRWISYLLFVLFMIPICLSRIFIAAHFPHQVVAGTACGALIAVFLERYTRIAHWRLQKYLWVSFGLFMTCTGLSLLLGHLGVDFHWSIPLATKWCKNPEEWISLSTTPYNSVIRTVFFLAGFGLGEYLHRRSGLRVLHPDVLHKFLRISLSLALVLLIDWIKLDSFSMLTFYALSALKHALFPVLVVYAIPYALTKLFIYEIEKREKVQ